MRATFLDSYWQHGGVQGKYRHLKGFLPRFKTLLDIGGGKGELRFDLSWNPHEYTLIDYSQLAVDHATMRGLNAHQCDVDTTVLPFADNSFDLVFVSHILEHMRNPWAVLAEASRVSSKYIFVKCPNMAFWKSRLATLFGRQPTSMRIDNIGSVASDRGHLDHIYYMTYDNCIRWAERLGLKVVKTRSWWYRRYFLFRPLLELFPNLGEGFEIIFEKPSDFCIPDNPNFKL